MSSQANPTASGPFRRSGHNGGDGFLSRCGAEVPATARFCPACGRPVDPEVGPQPPPPTRSVWADVKAAGLGPQRLGAGRPRRRPAAAGAGRGVGPGRARRRRGRGRGLRRRTVRGGGRVAPGLRRLRGPHRRPLRWRARSGAGHRFPAAAVGGDGRRGHRDCAALRLATAAGGSGPPHRLRRQAGARLRGGARRHRRAGGPRRARQPRVGFRQLRSTAARCGSTPAFCTWFWAWVGLPPAGVWSCSRRLVRWSAAPLRKLRGTGRRRRGGVRHRWPPCWPSSGCVFALASWPTADPSGSVCCSASRSPG